MMIQFFIFGSVWIDVMVDRRIALLELKLHQPSSLHSIGTLKTKDERRKKDNPVENSINSFNKLIHIPQRNGK